MVLTTNHKIIALGLAAALLGGTVGAFVEHSSVRSDSVGATSGTVTAPLDQNSPSAIPANSASQDTSLQSEQAAQDGQTVANGAVQQTRTSAVSRVQPVRARSTSRVVYAQPVRSRQQSGWEKHRDILSVAIGAGGGALLGGLIGGRKGTAIGAAAGGGGGALYTYKLRKKTNPY